MQQFHFIAGMNRSGSTMLVAILRQNPLFHASVSSPVYPLFRTLHRHMGVESDYLLALTDQKRAQVLQGLIFSYYADIQKPLVFDLHKHWTSRMAAIALLFPDAKVLCPVRDVCWIINSFETMFQSHPLIAGRMFGGYDASANVYTRVEAWVSARGGVGFPWNCMQEAYYGPWRDKLIIIDYDDICEDPEREMRRLYDRLAQPYFSHDFNNLEIPAEIGDPVDAMFGYPMHKIKQRVQVIERQPILPPDIFKRFQNKEFWLTGASSRAAPPPAAPAHSPAGAAARLSCHTDRESPAAAAE